jgi:hypothetical protein
MLICRMKPGNYRLRTVFKAAADCSGNTLISYMMKWYYSACLIVNLASMPLVAQIKIGNNPHEISQASVLELESEDKVLVITRVNNRQMEEITPLNGAMVFNTDTGCIHFYEGVSWQNLCNRVNVQLTSTPVVHSTPTLSIAELGNELHLEVLTINGDQIEDLSIGGNLLQANAVTERVIDFDNVTLADFQNDAGFITGNSQLSPEPGNAISYREGVFYDDSALWMAVSGVAEVIDSDRDSDDSNEIQELELQGSLLSISEGNSVDLSAFNIAGSDDQNLSGILLDGNILRIDIEDGLPAQVDLSALASGSFLQTAADLPFIPTGNTLAEDVQSAIEELQQELDGISAGGTANPTDELQGLSLEDAVLTLLPSANGNSSVDLDPLLVTEAELAALDLDDADADPANELQNISSTDGSVAIAAVGNDFDLSVPGGGSDDQDLTGAVLSGSSLTIGIENGNSVTANLEALVTDAELAALDLDDADADPANELQNISSPDASILVNRVGNDFEILFAGVPTSLNLANSDLAQTGGDRIYSLDGQNLSFAGSGSLGIGTTNPQSKLHVAGEVRSSGYANSNGVAGEPSYAFNNDPDTGMWRGSNVNYLRFSTAGLEAMTINPDQNIGLGTSTPTERLHVNGNILASGTITPDYVFEKYFKGYSELNPEYTMYDLKEIEAFIKAHYHLPGVPSARDVAHGGGVLVNRATETNLEKIEELFLHTIRQEKQLRDLLALVSRLSDSVHLLNTKIRYFHEPE